MDQIIYDQIEKFVNEIVHKFDPLRVILFGSYASDKTSPDSDVDLLVIMDFKGRSQLQALKIRKEIQRSFPLDLIVRKPSEINQRLAEGDFFLKEVLKDGKILYERTGH
ncbi:MAG: nucleotidyltransferase domain-containing protein [Candidatus Hodarchaeota archaeon]